MSIAELPIMNNKVESVLAALSRLSPNEVFNSNSFSEAVDLYSRQIETYNQFQLNEDIQQSNLFPFNKNKNDPSINFEQDTIVADESCDKKQLKRSCNSTNVISVLASDFKKCSRCKCNDEKEKYNKNIMWNNQLIKKLDCFGTSQYWTVIFGQPQRMKTILFPQGFLVQQFKNVALKIKPSLLQNPDENDTESIQQVLLPTIQIAKVRGILYDLFIWIKENQQNTPKTKWLLDLEDNQSILWKADIGSQLAFIYFTYKTIQDGKELMNVSNELATTIYLHLFLPLPFIFKLKLIQYLETHLNELVEKSEELAIDSSDNNSKRVFSLLSSLLFVTPFTFAVSVLNTTIKSISLSNYDIKSLLSTNILNLFHKTELYGKSQNTKEYKFSPLDTQQKSSEPHVAKQDEMILIGPISVTRYSSSSKNHLLYIFGENHYRLAKCSESERKIGTARKLSILQYLQHRFEKGALRNEKCALLLEKQMIPKESKESERFNYVRPGVLDRLREYFCPIEIQKDNESKTNAQLIYRDVDVRAYFLFRRILNEIGSYVRKGDEDGMLKVFWLHGQWRETLHAEQHTDKMFDQVLEIAEFRNFVSQLPKWISDFVIDFFRARFQLALQLYHKISEPILQAERFDIDEVIQVFNLGLDITLPIMDVYAMIAILHDIQIRTVVVYAGDDHSQAYRDCLYALKNHANDSSDWQFIEELNVYSETQCLTVPQPL